MSIITRHHVFYERIITVNRSVFLRTKEREFIFAALPLRSVLYRGRKKIMLRSAIVPDV